MAALSAGGPMAMLRIAGFLGATWLASRASKLLRISPAVLEIAVGLALGPSVLGLISTEYSTCLHEAYVDCEGPTDLEIRIASGWSLGEPLSRIASTDACHVWASTWKLGSGAPDPCDGFFNKGPSANPRRVQEESGRETNYSNGQTGDAGANSAAAREGGSGSGSSTAVTPPNDRGLRVVPPSPKGKLEAVSKHTKGTHRRLATARDGGAQYNSYAECLRRSCEADVAARCRDAPEIFSLVGYAAVSAQLFESGLHFDLSMVCRAHWAVYMVAVTGTILPVILGAAVVTAFGTPFVPDGLVAGTALAPTSVCLAWRSLARAGVLGESFGQAIVANALISNVLSLVLFNFLFSLSDGNFDAVDTIAKPIGGIVFIIAAGLAASKLWPWLVNNLAPLSTSPRGFLCGNLRFLRGMLPTGDEVLFVAMLCLLVLYAVITHLMGTHLLGCFVAGMSLAGLQPSGRAHRVWAKRTEHLTTWMVRLFFACTVAFSVPINLFFSWAVLGKGLLLGLGPCIIAKVISAAFLGHQCVVGGCAMVGRGELAYLIAQLGLVSGLLPEETFCVVLWALLCASVTAPLVFSYALGNHMRSNGIVPKGEIKDQSGGKQLDGFLDNPADGAVGLGDMAAHNEPNISHKVFDIEDAMGNDNRSHNLEAIKTDCPERETWHDAGCSGCGLPTATATECSSEVSSAIDDASTVPHLFPGGNQAPTGFLCCLFFKKVVME